MNKYILKNTQNAHINVAKSYVSVLYEKLKQGHHIIQPYSGLAKE